MHVNDSGAWRRGEMQARTPSWTFEDKGGYFLAVCKICGADDVLRPGREGGDLYVLDVHQRGQHQRCSGQLHTMPHVGCILR